jgi:hypothetical protein
MEFFGWILVALVALVVATGLTLGLMSLPDARRYLRLRRM